MLNTDFNLEEDIIGITEARANLPALVEDVMREHSQKVIIKNGKPAAVLVNVADFQALNDRVLAMELEASYKMALVEEKRGELIGLEELAEEFGFKESDFDLRRLAVEEGE